MMETVLQREVKGPTPHVVAVRAKHPKERISDKQIRKMRHNALKKEAIEAAVKQQHKYHLGVEWDLHIDRKFYNNLVQRKVDDTMQGFFINTEERRNRLRDLLEAEEEEYLAEIQANEITIKTRQEEMRKKVREIREGREKERQDFVTKKRDQQFREQCEELRNLLSQMHEKKVCEERAAQVAINEELKKQKLMEENMYMELWEKDRLAKEKREVDEALEKEKREEQTLLCLNAQMAIHKAQKEEARRLREEDALLMEKHIAKLKQDKEKARLEKKRKILETRETFQKAIEERNDRLAREKAEDVYLTNKLLEITSQEIRDEAEGIKQRKELMEREQRMYYNYLAQNWEAARHHEDEAGKFIAAEVAKVKAKRDAQLKHERDARQRLLEDVMSTRKLQIIEKLERETKEKDLEIEFVKKGLEELDFEDAESNARKAVEIQEYREQLKAQIDHQQKLREAEKAIKRKECEAGLVAHKAFNEKIKKVLETYQVDKEHTHPFRRSTFPR